MLDCAAKGVHGLVVISSGFAETGDEGRRRQRRLVGLARSYGLRLIGPNCLGVINTDPDVSLNASLSPLMPPRGRAGFFCQSGALGSAILEKVNNRGLGLSTFVSAGNRADVSGNDLLQYWEEDDVHRGRAALPRVDRQPAQVLPHRPPGLAAQADRRGPLGPHHPGRADGPRGPQHRRAPARRSTRCSGRPGSSRSTPWRTCSTSPSCSPTSRCPRGRRVAVVGNSDALGLLAADAAAAVGLVVSRSVALGRRRDRRGLRGRPRRRHRRPRRRLGGRGLHPAAQRHRRGGRQRPRGGGGAVRQAAGLHVPRRRGRARAAARPRRGRLDGRPRLGAVVPRGRGRGPRAGPGRGVRRVAAHPAGGGGRPRGGRPRAAPSGC